MKILVTGHRGYLGNGFLDRYGSEYDIVGYDLVDGHDCLDYPPEKIHSSLTDREHYL